MYYSIVITAAVLLCPTGDFDSQLRHILQERMLSTQDQANIISRVLGDVQPTLNKRWQGFEIFPFGSLTSGLGVHSSDADFRILLRNYNSSAELDVLEEVEKLFKEQPAIYSVLDFEITAKASRFSFFHIPLQRKVDLIFRTGDVLNASKLIRYYFYLDERFLPLGGFLKLWCKTHSVTGHALTNYGLYLLIIFYLQQKNMAPPGHALQIDSASRFSHGWDTDFNELPYRSMNTENLHQLLGGFFTYYSEFNFEEYIVSPFAGYPIRRSAFMEIEHFPKEFTLYKDNLKHTLQLRIKNNLNISTDICIQDMFIHDVNEGVRVTNKDVTKLKYLMTSAATKFQVLPSDRFLRAILMTDPHDETVTSHKNDAVNVISEQDCIEIP